ncbi:hypothetical protein ABXV19_08695 [Pseudomonas alkylphenolica]|uniref:hypothetical protein n=1 Tax=Pseudomonas alkylphenolica TaxID=237609 RepID=UPI0033972506
MAGSVNGETTLFTYTFFHVGARAALTSAENGEEGQSYHLLNALVLTSFLAEAYFNHLGELLGYPDWNNGKDKKTRIWEKYRLLRKAAGLSEASIDDAYPLVKDAINFRNTMAHGRTETHRFSMNVEDDVSLDPRRFPVGWQACLTTVNVRGCFDSCRSMIYELHKEAKFGDRPFSRMATSQMRYSSH